MNQAGFDHPKNLRTEDQLGRWDFAQELYSLLINAPKEWSVRVGIYGSWGEGKTTVLNFIYEIAKSEKQTIIRFNPWGYQSTAEFWESFTITLYNTLKQFNADIKLSNKLWVFSGIKIKRFIRKPITWLEPLAKVSQYSEYGIPILKNFLNFNSKYIERIPELVKDKRVIVILDDLERANPILISQVLFTVKELLDLPGFSFAIAFDPEIVNTTMRQNNIRYGEDKDFLEKIIEFPRWIPKPNDEELRLLIKSEVAKDINFIPINAFERVFQHLPKNPRKLKQFIRSFLGFKEELNRYETEEINWTILLLLNLLKSNFPSVADTIVKNQNIWDAITTDKWFGKRAYHEEKIKEYAEELSRLCDEKGINDVDKHKILEIIKEIADTNFPLTVGGLDSYTYLTERKNIITWKEYNALLLNFEKNPKKEIIEDHISSLVKTTFYSKNNILSALFEKAIEYRTWSLGMASDSILEEEVINHTNDANLALEIIRKICFDFEGFVGPTPFLSDKHFSKLYEMITRWLHFTMPNKYLEAREFEKELLNDLCKKMSIELMVILKHLEPWMPYRHSAFDSKIEKEIADKLGLIIEERVSNQLIDKFLIKDWTFNIFLRDEHLIEHYILLRKSSYFWTSELRIKFFELLEKNKDDEIIVKNMYHLLTIIASTFFDPVGGWSVVDGENAIINDKEVMVKIWEIALYKRLNPRMFTSVERFRNTLKEKTNLELSKPEWWDEIKKMVQERSNEK